MCNPRPHSLLSVGTGAQMPQRRGAGQGTAKAAAHAAPAPPPAAAGLDYGKEEVALGSAFPAAFLALLAQRHRPVGACIAELMPAWPSMIESTHYGLPVTHSHLCVPLSHS